MLTRRIVSPVFPQRTTSAKGKPLVPKQVFTDTMIRTAKAADSGTRFEATDTRCQGLTFRVTDGGVKTFAFIYRSRIDGKVRRLTLGRYPDVSLAKARELADGHRKTVTAGRDPVSEKTEAFTAARRAQGLVFDQVADRYIEEYAKPNKSSWKNDDGYLKRARGAWAKRPIASITDDDAASLLDDIAKTAPVSANRTQAVLHKLFAWSKDAGRKFVTVNPLADMPRRAKETTRDRVLSDTEIKKLWHGLDDPKLPLERSLGLALKMILCTMARPGEVAEAEIAELERLTGNKPEWHLPARRVKNRRAFIYPLSSLTVSIINESIVDEDQLAIFPSKFSKRATIARHSLSQSVLEIVLPFIKIEHFTPHDLRRTAATIARRAGAPRDGVDALLNHTKDDVTAVYDRYDMLAEKRVAAETLERELLRVVGPKRLAA
jgi:integrase